MCHFPIDGLGFSSRFFFFPSSFDEIWSEEGRSS